MQKGMTVEESWLSLAATKGLQQKVCTDAGAAEATSHVRRMDREMRGMEFWTTIAGIAMGNPS